MGSTLDSFDNMLSAAATYGIMTRFFQDRISSATTAGTTGSGHSTWQRYPNGITMPSSFGAGVTGAYMTYCSMTNEDQETGMICAIEYDMGNINIAGGGTFTDGVAMPSKTIRFNGTNYTITTASQMCLAYISTTLVATTPTITVTYTDQDGNTGNSAAFTAPTGAIANSCFYLTPVLAAGDSGIRDVTNITTSGGTSGVIRVLGLLVLGVSFVGTPPNSSKIDYLTFPSPKWPIGTSERISFFRVGNNVTNQLTAVVSMVADN